jgi:type IV pilus assembly protein PilV
MMKTNPRNRSEDGFTILEVMIAVGVLAFGLLTLAIMQLQALNHGARGRHSHDAASIARSFLEQTQRIPWTDLTTAQAAGTWTAPNWAGSTSTVTVAVETPNGGTVTTTAYTVAWQLFDVLDASNNPRPCLRDIELRVTWSEEDRSSDKALQLDTRRYNWGGTGC